MNPLGDLSLIGCNLFGRLLTAIFTAMLTGLICWVSVASLTGDGESVARIGTFCGLVVGFLFPAAIAVPMAIVSCAIPGFLLGVLISFVVDEGVDFWLPAGAIAGASLGVVVGVVILAGFWLTNDEDAQLMDQHRPGDNHQGQRAHGTDDGDSA